MLITSVGLALPPISTLLMQTPPRYVRSQTVATQVQAEWLITTDRTRFAVVAQATPFKERGAAEHAILLERQFRNRGISQIVHSVEWDENGSHPYWFNVSRHNPEPYPSRHSELQYGYGVGTVAYGAPLRAFRYEVVHYWVPPEVEPDALQAFRVKYRGCYFVTADFGLPILPIWPGLFLNTLFYAAIWFAFFTGLAAVRTGRRLRRGLCPVCRYDLRGLPERACPECGWGRKPAAPRGTDT